jgi:hypothetical protein
LNSVDAKHAVFLSFCLACGQSGWLMASEPPGASRFVSAPCRRRARGTISTPTHCQLCASFRDDRVNSKASHS